MKLQIIKQFELGDCCFFLDPDERKYLIEQLHVVSLFGQIIGIDPDGSCTVKFMCEGAKNITAKVSPDSIEWFDVLYDIGPQTMSNKYGEDLSNNFIARGLMYKSAMRAERLNNTTFKRGDMVFDLDRRAEGWVDDYMVANYHKDTFGIVDEITQDENGATFYVINYGEELPFSRYSYEIGPIQRFPKKDDPWYSEYTFSRMDNIRMDMLQAGNLDEYITGYLEELDRRKAESEAKEDIPEEESEYEEKEINDDHD